MITAFLKDIRFALRQLLKARGFLTVAVLTLALGIGANTAIFTLIHAIMLKSLPVAHPETLVRVGDSDNCCVIGGLQGRFSIFSYPLYLQLRDNTPEFEQMAAFQAGIRKVGVRRPGDSGMSEPFASEFVSGNYFSTLGLQPEIGRLIEPTDDVRSAPPSAVISFRAWQHYGGNSSILGSTFIIDGAPYTVMGVAPRTFFGETLRPDPPDFWLPLATEVAMHKENALLDRPDNHWLYIIGRIKPGFEQKAVESKLNAELIQWLMSEEPPSTDSARQEIQKQHIGIVPAGSGVALLQLYYERDLRLLLMITSIVLLIACANVANLQLARGAGNASQMAIRVALGAGRGRVIRQVLTESILLAVIGGVAGLLVAAGLTRLLIRLAFDQATYVPIGTAPDLAVLGFAFLLSLFSGTIFGIAPAWSASGADPAESLRRKGRSGSSSTTRLQKSLVFLQAALSLTLLAGAGLMVQTVRNLQSQQFGFELSGRTVVNVNAGLGGYGPERMAAVYNSVDQRMHQIPGVSDVSLVLYSPMAGNNWQSGGTLEDHPDARISPSWDRVSPSFFRTIGARLLRGRLFDERDTPDSTHVAVINRSFAEKYLPNEDPLGKRFGLGGQEHRADYQIVGIVDNVLFRNPRNTDVPPMFFIPLLQMSDAEWADSTMARSNLIGSIILHVSGSPSNLIPQVQTALAAADPNLTTLSVVTMEELLHSQLQHERLITQLAELLGVLALVLASIGLYGITSYAVVRRTSEIGVRTALGATRWSVIGLVLKNALSQIGVGLLLGIPGALFAGRILSDQLYQVNARDPVIVAAAAAVVIFSAAVAAIIPAFRAGAIDPIIALRAE